jgi:hypothetical protein
MTISLMHKSVHSSAIFLIIFLCFFIAGGLAAATASVMFFNATALIHLVRHREGGGGAFHHPAHPRVIQKIE